jgi:hypothetical protein
VVIDDFFRHSQGPLRVAGAYFAQFGYRPVYHVMFPYAVAVRKGEEPPANMFRSIDGNRYSFDIMRACPVFRQAVAESAQQAATEQRADCAARAEIRLRLLGENAGHASDEIYRYLQAMASYWDDMDSEAPAEREQLLL